MESKSLRLESLESLKILKASTESCSEILTKQFNDIILSSDFPDKIKVADVSSWNVDLEKCEPYSALYFKGVMKKDDKAWQYFERKIFNGIIEKG